MTRAVAGAAALLSLALCCAASKDGPIYNVYFVMEGRIKLSAEQTKPSQASNPLASPLEIKADRVTGIVGLRAKAIRVRVLIGLYDVQESVINVGPSAAGGQSLAPDYGVFGIQAGSHARRRRDAGDRPAGQAD